MKAKYYTPKRNEFHEGFVFEANYKKEGWQKEIFGIGERSISSVPQLLYQFLDGAPLDGNIRVKLLDREDLRECGWDDKVWDNFSGYSRLSRKNKLGEDVEYTFGFHSSDYMTISQNDYGNNIILFQGLIRNKSELKKLMQMLNIK